MHSVISARGGIAELEQIQERYMSCLKSFVEHSAPSQPSRFNELLVRLPEVSVNFLLIYSIILDIFLKIHDIF